MEKTGDFIKVYLKEEYVKASKICHLTVHKLIYDENHYFLMANVENNNFVLGKFDFEHEAQEEMMQLIMEISK